jgi:ribosomal protein L18
MLRQQLEKLVAEKALKAGIEVVTFDRGGYLYHSLVLIDAKLDLNGMSNSK